MGRAARRRRCELPQSARLPLRTLGLLSREADGGGLRVRAGRGRAGGDRAAAPHREAGDQGHVHARRPDRRPSLRPAAEIVRIYSTSGTTGTPSYIPLTAGDLDNWVTGSARSYAASGVAAGERIVRTYNAGPFAAGAALAAFERIGLTHIPVGTGNTERLAQRSPPRPEAAVLTPSYAAYLVEWAAEREFDLEGSSVERVLVAGEPGGGEQGFRAKLEEGWGARVTEAMGVGDIGVSLWGECEAAGRHASRRARLRSRRADRPETGAALEMDDGATGELVLTHLQPSRGPAPAVPHPRPRRGSSECLQMRPHRPARAVHRAHRRHADRPRGERVPLGRARGGRRVRARGQRAHPRQAAGARRQAGAAAARQRRARAWATADPALADSIRESLRESARRPDERGARSVGKPAAKRVQVEARRAVGVGG